MSNDIKLGKRAIQIIFDGMSDFDYGQETEVFAMMFFPLVGDEYITVLDDPDGIEMFSVEAVNAADHQIRTFHGRGKHGGKIARPFVNGSAAKDGTKLIIDFG